MRPSSIAWPLGDQVSRTVVILAMVVMTVPRVDGEDAPAHRTAPSPSSSSSASSACSAWSVSAESMAPTSQPTADTPRDPHARIDAPRQGLRPLYDIPRSADTNPGGDVHRAPSSLPASRPATAPHDPWSRLGYLKRSLDAYYARITAEQNDADSDAEDDAYFDERRPYRPMVPYEPPGYGDGVPGCSPGYYGRERSRLTDRQREWANYRYFAGRPSRYGHGRYDRYAEMGDGHGNTFRFGFMEGYDMGRFEGRADERTESVLAHANARLDKGVRLFKQGQYRAAADAFRLAAELDQGDAASRLCAGHSLFALGRYREAIQYIRRAFELQPHILYLTFDLRAEYGRGQDFQGHYENLVKAHALASTNLDRLLMLGYIRYYTGQRRDAYRVLDRAYELNPRDDLVRRLRDNARPSDVELEAMRNAP